MKTITYTDSDRAEIFSKRLKEFKRNERLFKTGKNVFKPRITFGTFKGSCEYGVYIEMSYKVYDKDLKCKKLVSTNFSAKIERVKGKFVISEEIPLNIRKIIPLDMIDECIFNLIKDHGVAFEKIFIKNKILKTLRDNEKKSKEAITIFNL